MSRKLKVYEKFIGSTNCKSVPTIILRGKWLKDAGFEIGEYVEVECIDDKITLTKTTPPELPPKKSLEEKIEGLSDSKRKKLSEMIDKL